jgi:hypothetical protein
MGSYRAAIPIWRSVLVIGIASFFLSAPAIGANNSAPARAQTAPTIRTAPLHYIGTVQIIPETGLIGASWTIIIKDPSLDRIDLALNASFAIASLSGTGVQAHSLTSDPRFDDGVTVYGIDLFPAAGVGNRIVRVSYSGVLFPTDTPYGINTVDDRKVELTVDSFWFPFDVRFGTDLTATVNVRIKGDWSAVGVGAVKQTASGHYFQQTTPALDIALSLLKDSLTVLADDYVIYDARPEPGAKLTELEAALDSCATYLNRLSGAAGPLPPASVIITDRPEGGYSRGTLIALTDIENEDEEAMRQFICHELAHYWSKANAGGPENWINEGVADYLANMAIRDTMGADVFAARMARYADQLEGEDLPSIWTPDLTKRAPYLTLYRAGPLALFDLERRLGLPAFEAFMQDVMHAKPASTPDLLDLLADTHGADVRDWFAARLAE